MADKSEKSEREKAADRIVAKHAKAAGMVKGPDGKWYVKDEDSLKEKGKK
jgi:hypothetical protein